MTSHLHPTSLRDALATLYPRDADARRVARDAGLTEALIPFDPTAVNTWSAILTEAQKHDQIENVLAIALKEYPNNAPLRQAVADYRNSLAVPAAPSVSPPSVSRRHLETQRNELQRRYTMLTKRITALDTDIGRELDAERKLVLDERRASLVAERKITTRDLEQTERQLQSGVVQQTWSSVPAVLSPDERASLARQLVELRNNLRLIEERKTEYIQATDIPLQLVKDERRLREHIAELEMQLGHP